MNAIQRAWHWLRVRWLRRGWDRMGCPACSHDGVAVFHVQDWTAIFIHGRWGKPK